ncbi:hypothetical protein KKF81_00280 [Candidatus Micrarchaeota archaeon]|nr:hypothetical protein [Candidatus Micrarchaeota archaeon]
MADNKKRIAVVTQHPIVMVGNTNAPAQPKKPHATASPGGNLTKIDRIGTTSCNLFMKKEPQEEQPAPAEPNVIPVPRHERQQRRKEARIRSKLLDPELVHGKTDEYEPVLELEGECGKFRHGIRQRGRGLPDWNGVMARGERECLCAQGTQYFDLFINTMLEGRIKYGHWGSLKEGPADICAASHGPYYVVIDKDHNGIRKREHKGTLTGIHSEIPEEAHILYLVPDEQDKELVTTAINQATKLWIITKEEAEIVLSKLVTYEEFATATDDMIL